MTLCAGLCLVWGATLVPVTRAHHWCAAAGAPWGSAGHIFLCHRKIWGTPGVCRFCPACAKLLCLGVRRSPRLCWSLADNCWTQPPGSVVPQKRFLMALAPKSHCSGVGVYAKLWTEKAQAEWRVWLWDFSKFCCFRLLWSVLLGTESPECKYTTASSDPSQSIVCLGSTYLLFKNRMFKKKLYKAYL